MAATADLPGADPQPMSLQRRPLASLRLRNWPEAGWICSLSPTGSMMGRGPPQRHARCSVVEPCMAEEVRLGVRCRFTAAVIRCDAAGHAQLNDCKQAVRTTTEKEALLVCGFFCFLYSPESSLVTLPHCSLGVGANVRPADSEPSAATARAYATSLRRHVKYSLPRLYEPPFVERGDPLGLHHHL